MQFFNQIKNRRRSSQMTSSHNPVLTPEDEAFLQKVTSDPEHRSGPAVEYESESQQALTEDPQAPVAGERALEGTVPASPQEELGRNLGEEDKLDQKRKNEIQKEAEPVKPEEAAVADKKVNRWSTMFWKKAPASDKVSIACLSPISLRSINNEY